MVELVTALEQAHRESPSWRLYGLCHQAATRIAELEAENERLRNMLNGYGKLDAELAIAERRAEALSRTSAVKVKALEWRGNETVWLKADAEFGGIYHIMVYAGMPEPFKLETCGWWSGQPCDHYATLDEAKAAAQADYERRILSTLTTEPAAPEGQQEPVAFRWRNTIDPTMWNVGFAHQAPSYAELEPLYNRPSEQAVTEAMVEVAAKAVVAEWQKMVAETSPHMPPGDHARAFVSPGNYRLIRAALKAAMEA